MSTRFYPRQTDYVAQLNTMDDSFNEAIAATATTAASVAAAAASQADALASKNAAAASQADVTTKQSDVTTKQTAAAGNAAAASASNTNAQIALAGTTSAAAQAATARDQANAAWAAAMSPAETLPAISKSIHSGAIVKAIIYDTGKDSDGGAWRKRCADKSWYNEALGFTGTWRNQLATTAAAWAISGAAAGDGFQNTTDGKYYVLTGTTTASEIFRGNVREFPEQVAIVAESARVVIYDLTQVGTPMWMVFVGGTGVVAPLFDFNRVGRPILCIAASQGSLFYGAGGAGDAGVTCADFIRDKVWRRGGNPSIGYTGWVGGNLSNRTTGFPTGPDGTALGTVVNGTVTDIAATVLDNAPVDPATGLRVPTIAVATNGGVSVINNDGTVTNLTYTVNANNEANFVRFLTYGGIGWGSRNGDSVYYQIKNKIPATNDSTPPDRYYNSPSAGNGSGYLSYRNSAAGEGLRAVAATGKMLALGTDAAVSVYKENPASPTNGMVAYIAKAYNSGWQVGDSRLACLADTVAGTITASGELVTNGTFDTDISGWTPGAGAASWSGGSLLITLAGGVTYGSAYQALAVVAGKTYNLTGQYTRGTGTSANLRVGTGPGDSSLGIVTLASNGTFQFSFTPAGTTVYVSFVSNGLADGQTNSADNISVKLAEPDRSVKNKGGELKGTLTKSAVASGANLVMYSGFSPANRVEFPYDAGLDFGTGDFSVIFWELAVATGQSYRFSRGGVFGLNSDVSFTYRPTIGVQLSTGIAQVTGLHLICMVREAGLFKFYIDGVLRYSVANTQDISGTTPVLRVGTDGNTSPTWGGVTQALFRISATAPSDNQIAHIYRTELPLFQSNAQCTIDGTSTAVTVMAYDDTTDVLQVGTSWGRSAFKDLVRIESAVSTVGAITSLSANQGSHITGGASSGRYYQPALLLRDELCRRDEARKALGKVPVFFDSDTISFTATTANASNSLTSVSVTTGTPYVGMGITGTGIPAGTTITSISGATYTLSANATAAGTAVVMGQSSFDLPKGYTAKAVYSAEALKREGATKTWTRAFDGFKETINFGTSPGNAVWVSIMAVRSN